jgi:hypothetical protein
MVINMKAYSSILIYAAILALQSCNYITVTSYNTKKKIILEKPSAFLCERIVDFRIAEGGWPISKLDFLNKGIKYYEAIKDFPYQTIEFKIKDSTEMTFYFNNHIKDIENYNKTKKVNLKSFNGKIKFWKKGDKFLWKIKMN